MANVNVASAAISAGIGAVVAFVGAAGKSYLDARRTVDQSLRTQRSPVYQSLWLKTRLFQMWPRSTISYADAGIFQRQLADWYYEEGGLYLSRTSQRVYVKLQKALTQVLGSSQQGEMTTPHWQLVHKRCSRLRTALTTDLLSRRSGRGIL